MESQILSTFFIFFRRFMTNIDKFVRIIIGDTMFIRRISYFMLFLGMILIISGSFSLIFRGITKGS